MKEALSFSNFNKLATNPGKNWQIYNNQQKTREKTRRVIDGSHIFVGGRKKKEKQSFMQKKTRQGLNKAINLTEKGINIGKTNFINPYIQAQINTFSLFTGEIVERNESRAIKTGGLWLPKLVRSSTIGSYTSTWLTNFVPGGKFIFRVRNKLMSPIYKIANSIWKGGNKGLRKIEKSFYSPNTYRRKIFNRKIKKAKLKAKTRGKIVQLENYIQKKVKLPRIKANKAA